MRRCGKSYLLFTLFKEHLRSDGIDEDHIIEKDVITEFRGRGDEVHMNPLSFAEFMSVYPGTKQDGWNEYMLYGGIPVVLAFTTPD